MPLGLVVIADTDKKKTVCVLPNLFRILLATFQFVEIHAVEDNNWSHVADALQASEQLLEATLVGNEAAVARGIDVVARQMLVGVSYDKDTKQHECHIRHS